MIVVAAAVSASLALAAATPSAIAPSDVLGRVTFSGLAVPGATVTAQGAGTRDISTTTDEDGVFRLANLADGTWTLRIEMRGFVTEKREIVVPSDAPPLSVGLTMRPLQEIVEVVGRPANAGAPAAQPSPVTPALEPPPDGAEIITGSTINGAASPFAQPRAFGNSRPNQPRFYTGGFSTILGNSAWNARPYSLIGSTAPAPSYNDAQFGFTIGGPLKIPWLITYGPQTILNLQHGVVHNAITQAARVPTAAERAGDFSASSVTIRDPLTGLPFPGNVIPPDRISPQATALARFYPPAGDVEGGSNFQAPIVSATTTDRAQLSISKTIRMRTTLTGNLTFQRAVTDSANLFGFTDKSRQTSLNTSGSWAHRFRARLSLRATYQFTRTGATVTPFFANRTNVSGEAGITGNDQDPVNWGPPALVFPGIAGLSDADYQRSVRFTHAAGLEATLGRGGHNITVGGDARLNRTDVFSQPEPRGTLTFTGAATGDAFGDFLLGLPAASSIAFGTNAIHLRGLAGDAYVNDDWRLRANLTINLGLRWEYEAPFTEASGRLANLDVAPGFAAVTPVVPSDSAGPLTGQPYPRTLIWSDRRGIQPRLGLSWRPSLASSLVIRAGYSVNRNLGVYESLALLLAQQPPFARTFNVQNGPATPLTLADPFPSGLPGASNTFAIDPHFRSADAQTWQLIVQRELPASLTVIGAYTGTKGTHLMQAVLPNTYPDGASNPCPSCPAGFVYLTSNGRSIKHSGQFTLRRRLAGGLMASVQYTLATAFDDAATFSNRLSTVRALSVAQDWLNRGAEWGPSPFDQRHQVAVQFQFTTGMGMRGGTLVDGMWGKLFKDWTITAQLNAGSGLPLTPELFAAVSGTGVVGVRPSLSGVSPQPVNAGSYANPAAYTVPPPGQWGDAGRNSIRGPRPFSFDMTASRVFRLGGRWNLEWRVAATNVLNRVTFSSVGTVITSPQFGFPTAANAMQTLQTTIRLRF